jgi:hypothetical protein
MWEGAALCTSRRVGRCRPYAQSVPALLYGDTGTGNYEHCRLTCVTPEPQTYLRLPFHYAPFEFLLHVRTSGFTVFVNPCLNRWV